MDWSTAFILWTPIAVGLLAAFLAILFVILLVLWVNRTAVGAYVTARLAENSTKHGFNTAFTATGVWLASQGTAPLWPLLLAWAAALYLIVKPDATDLDASTDENSLVGTVTAAVAPVASALIVMLFVAVGVSGCAEWQGAVTAADKTALAIQDQVQRDVAAGVIQTRCRLPYNIVQTLGSTNPNFTASQAIDCGTLPSSPPTAVTGGTPTVQTLSPSTTSAPTTTAPPAPATPPATTTSPAAPAAARPSALAVPNSYVAVVQEKMAQH